MMSKGFESMERNTDPRYLKVERLRVVSRLLEWIPLYRFRNFA